MFCAKPLAHTIFETNNSSNSLCDFFYKIPDYNLEAMLLSMCLKFLWKVSPNNRNT